MEASGRRDGERGGDELAALDRAYTKILDEARAQVAAGREPALDGLEQRVRAATKRELAARRLASSAALEQAEREALGQLARVALVVRARSLLARERERAIPPAPAPRPERGLGSRLRIRPTIVANMDVQRGPDGDRLTLAWEPVPAVVEWEVRFSERPDPRGSYVQLDSVTLPATETAVEVPIGEHLFRVNILGRSRDGRLLRRALISSLARETWNDRWERRASAS